MQLIKRCWINKSYFRHLLLYGFVSRCVCHSLFGFYVADSFIRWEPCTCRPHLRSFMELHCSPSYQIWTELFLLHHYRYVQSCSAFLVNNTVQVTEGIVTKTRGSTFRTTSLRFRRILISLSVLSAYDRPRTVFYNNLHSLTEFFSW
jgi:hypothetical protein